MQENKDRIILQKRDYDLLVKYIFSNLTPLSTDNRNAEQLYEELKNAVILEGDGPLPHDVIRLHSKVEVVEKFSGRNFTFTIVLPSEANVGKRRLSVFAPLGVALMGYRKGQRVYWQMPSGDKEFFVKNVINQA
jgi:regulator of nucleoside diphosphate kinase